MCSLLINDVVNECGIVILRFSVRICGETCSVFSATHTHTHSHTLTHTHILSGKLHVAEQERDRLSGENERLELQNQQLKGSQSRMVEEHARTLERFNLMWRQKCPVSWDEVSLLGEG